MVDAGPIVEQYEDGDEMSLQEQLQVESSPGI